VLGDVSGTVAPAVRAAFGIVLIQSAIAKWQRPEAFARAFLAYPVLRTWPGVRGAAVVPALELLLGAGLLFLQSPVGTAAAWGALLFVMLATAAIVARRIQGERRFVCGCGSDFESERSFAGLLARNLASAAALLGSVQAASPHYRPPGIPLLFVGLAAVLAGRLARAAMFSVRAAKEQEWKALG
jgi:hypothetical protein